MEIQSSEDEIKGPSALIFQRVTHLALSGEQKMVAHALIGRPCQQGIPPSLKRDFLFTGQFQTQGQQPQGLRTQPEQITRVLFCD